MSFRYVHITRSQTVRNPDGSIKDIIVRIIKHKCSYITWNDVTKNWDETNVKCNCELCKEETQMTLFNEEPVKVVQSRDMASM